MSELVSRVATACGWSPLLGLGPVPTRVVVSEVIVWAATAAVPCVMLWHARGQPGPARRLLSLLAVCAAGTALAHALRHLPAADAGTGVVVAAAAVAASVGAVVLLVRRLAPAVAAVRDDTVIEHDRLVLLEAAVAASGDGVMIAAAAAADSPAVRIVYANPAFERMMGYAADEAVGLSPSIFCHTDAAGERPAEPAAGGEPESGERALDAVRAALRGSEPVRLEVASRRKDGSRMWAEWQVVPVSDGDGPFTHYVAVLRDTTERRRLEEQLREAQKMDAIGRLAGGVAHDFNNLLTVIRGNAELLLVGEPEAGERPVLVDEIRGAAERGAGLVRQLLTFGRRQGERAVVLDLNAVVGELAGMLRRLLGERVAVAAHLAPGPVPARIDRSQLEQVVMNLAVNARDAMPRGGTLTITTAVAGGPPDARWARLTVSDTGVGMTEAVRARIFEPFFTTKEVGKGTGLGLATVYGIVTQSGGRVRVNSAVGAGTSFRVELPWCDEPMPAHSGVHTPAPVRPAAGGRGTRLLLVEDEDGVRKLARITLASSGYEVVEAADGEAALELLAAGPPIDLIITDLTMPGMGGRELVARVRAGWPGVGVVFLSGYASDMALLDAVPGALFLAKPFAPADLLKAAGRAAARAARAAAPA